MTAPDPLGMELIPSYRLTRDEDGRVPRSSELRRALDATDRWWPPERAEADSPGARGPRVAARLVGGDTVTEADLRELMAYAERCALHYAERTRTDHPMWSQNAAVAAIEFGDLIEQLELVDTLFV